MSASPGRSTTKKLIASLAILAAVGAFVSFGVFSSFSKNVTNTGSVTTGTLDLSNTPSGSLISSLTDLIPGDIVSRCIAVTKSGNLPADVLVTPSVTGDSALQGVLKVAVEEGTALTATDGTCTGFGGTVTPILGTTSLTDSDTGGILASALSTTKTYSSFTGTKYFRLRMALPTTATLSVAGLTTQVQLDFTATPHNSASASR